MTHPSYPLVISAAAAACVAGGVHRAVLPGVCQGSRAVTMVYGGRHRHCRSLHWTLSFTLLSYLIHML